MTPAVRVVVVEDSAVQRARLVAALEAEGDIRVLGQAGDGADALALVRRLRPDVVTMDLGLPGEGGMAAIEHIMADVPTPVLVLSAQVSGAASGAAMEALLAGALEALPKPERWDDDAERLLRGRVRLLSRVTVVAHPRGRRRPAARAPASPPLVAIAASTGGPAALAELLPGLDELPAAVLIVQHLHPQLVDGFVSWMQRVTALRVVMAGHGDHPQPGVVYVAPAGSHLKLAPRTRLALDAAPPRLHRPSADELFSSVAASAAKTSVGVLLTGMGDDGAAGLLALRGRGGTTIAQDERSSVVFGMPGAAQQLGAAAQVLPLDKIPGAVRTAIERLAR